jgi:predicted RNA-binding Zn-ribbon protein involved in translation (DUF1610 family)
MPAREGASGREWGQPDRIAEGTDSTPSIAAPDAKGKQDFGTCIGCGIRIAPSNTTLRCPTCAAWARWFSAHRLASQALRETTR